MRSVARRAAAIALVLACGLVVVGYQGTRASAASSGKQPFVPSPQFFLDFSPSFRTTIADAYWLQTIQYYGEHVATDGEFEQLKPMLDLVTELSPRHVRAYLFGAYALLDAGRGNDAYRLLERGFRENPDAWQLATNAGILMYSYGPEDVKRKVAADWFAKAARVPGAPAYVSRVAARLLGEGGRLDEAIALYAETYATGDKYSRAKAIAGLDRILPQDATQRERALAGARDLMAPGVYDQLVRALLGQ